MALTETLLDHAPSWNIRRHRYCKTLLLSSTTVAAVALLGVWRQQAAGSQSLRVHLEFDERSLLRHPLQEFVKRSAERGACDVGGAPKGFPVPWAMTLATAGATSASAPALRSIGIQGIVDGAVFFVCRGGPGGTMGPRAGLASYNASMHHLAGNYPGADFEEQWRAEGTVREVPLAMLREVGLMLPEPALVAQILGSSAFAAARAQSHGGSLAPMTREGRLVLSPAEGDDADADALARETSDAGERGGDEDEAYHAGLRAYTLIPHRVELLHGGPDWPSGPVRYEWVRDTEQRWSRPVRLVPYSWPQ